MGINITQDAHNKLIKLVKAIQEKQKDFTEFNTKLETIDIAYAKHEVKIPSTGEGQEDETAVKVPVVNSEIDDNVAYLASIFVNKHPLFPVLSNEGDAKNAMMLQTMLSKDARQQRWGRQLLKFLVASARYNIGGIEVEKIDQQDITVSNKENDPAEFDIIADINPVTTLKALDMYNALFDYRVDPADVTIKGDYAGYNEIVSKTTLKALGNSYSEAKTAYNLAEAYASGMEGTEDYWNVPPDISTLTPDSAAKKEGWFDWIGIVEPKDGDMKLANSSYFLTRLYVRIIPSEFGISIPGKNNHPVIIKLTVVNNKWIINYQEVITPLNALPILFSDTREDGFGYQTKSAGENTLPYQQTATELLHTRIGGAKRALNDRAIFDSDHLDAAKVNSTNPSAKIPLKGRLQSAGERPPLNALYYQIPFESRGTEGAITDLSTILHLKDQVNGNNFAFRGEQVKGNRTRGEFEGLAGKAEGKALPTAIRIEEQVMILLKLMLKLNVLTSTIIDKQILNEEDGSLVNINIAELRKAMLGFKITDGLLPKTAVRDPEVLSMAMQFIQNDPELNQTHDKARIFGDLMSILDVDISKHERKKPLQPPQSIEGEPNNATAPAAAGPTNSPGP